MSTKRRRARAGFTLVEVVITLAIFSAVLTAIYTVVIWSQQTFTSGTRRQENQQAARLAMAQMIRHIRMTGYISENFNTDSSDDIPAAGSTVASVVVPPIFMASSSRLALFGNLDGGAASRVFLYCLDTANRQLLFKTGTMNAAASYTCSGTAGDILADNVEGLTFTYYNLVTTAPATFANWSQLAFSANGYLDGARGDPYNDGGATIALGAAANALSFPTSTAATELAKATSRLGVRAIRIQMRVSQGSPMQRQEYTLNSTVELRNFYNSGS